MQPVDSLRLRPRRPNAFTLIEMLIVIAIMAILMTAGAVGLSGLGGKNVTSAVSSTESLFDEARTMAMSKNVRSCVLISRTLPNAPSDVLRRVLVATEETNADGTAKDPKSASPNWVLSSRGILLPDQVYFSQVYSKEHFTSNSSSGSIDLEWITSDDKIKGAKASQKGTYYIYKFSPQGLRITAGNDQTAPIYPASFIVGAGIMGPNKSSSISKPKIAAGERRDFGGFVIWRGGNTSLIRSPDQISPDIKKLQPGKDEF